MTQLHIYTERTPETPKSNPCTVCGDIGPYCDTSCQLREAWEKAGRPEEKPIEDGDA